MQYDHFLSYKNLQVLNSFFCSGECIKVDMKQKIVIKVEMKSEKSKSKAMKIAAGKDGVSSVKIGGEEKDRVVVIGDEVNIIDLILSLKKKVGSARIISVRVLNGEGNYEYDNEDENKLHFTTAIQSPRMSYYQQYSPYPHFYNY